LTLKNDSIISILQKGFGSFVVMLLILWLFVAPSTGHTAQNHRVKIIYFFSPSSPDCIDAEPAVIALGREYSMEGYNFGKIAPRGYPFPVKPGDKKNARKVYGIKGIPSLVVIIDGVYKQKMEGAADIQDAKSIIKALSGGAMTVTEAAKNAKKAEFTVSGWIVAKGKYFKNVRFMLTDRTTEIRVKAWLPLEAVKSPIRKESPRLMSNVIGKPVVLRGSLTPSETGCLFLVKEEIPSD
jgi:thiol-disulfide isomerase/thioredoxin